MHLLADISGHGFGHLALSAPVLNALAERLPNLQLTIRSGLPLTKLHSRIHTPFTHIAQASDFGFVMHDALRIDLAASAARYQSAHENWPARVAQEAAWLTDLAPDAVFSNVAYLPLAGAALAGIPAIALCPLNWADLFEHFYGQVPWAAAILRQMHDAYHSAANFLCPAPSMPMPGLARRLAIGPIAALGRRVPLHDQLPGHPRSAVLVVMGGVQHRLPVENWPDDPNLCWLVQADWHIRHPRAVELESLNLDFPDLLASVDAVITKPGYGIFAEAACNGTPVLYQRRDNWPEQDHLIPWLHAHGRARELSAEALQTGDFVEDLAALLDQTPPPRPVATGARDAANHVAELAAR